MQKKQPQVLSAINRLQCTYPPYHDISRILGTSICIRRNLSNKQGNREFFIVLMGSHCSNREFPIILTWHSLGFALHYLTPHRYNPLSQNMSSSICSFPEPSFQIP